MVCSSPTEVGVAIGENVSWCALVCRAHGVAGEQQLRAWLTQQPAPPLYPDAVTTSPEATVRDLATVLGSRPNCSVKDSFATLDLSNDGFQVLFEGRWLFRRPGRPPPANDTELRWTTITDPAQQPNWRQAWSGGDNELLEILTPVFGNPDVTVLAAYADDEVLAGAVLHRDPQVVGVSNVFTREDQPDDWSGLVAAAADIAGSHPLVGYLSDDSLTTARDLGFQDVGPMRVWLRAEDHQ